MQNAFAVVIFCKEIRNSTGEIVTHENDQVIVTKGEWGDTSEEYLPNDIEKDVKIFFSEKDAIKFARKWKGHPSYYMPNGKFEIIRIEPITKKIVVGYKTVSTQPAPGTVPEV